MEAHNENSNLYNQNISHRGNGAISIKSFVCFPFPLSISQYMRCNIAMVKSHRPVNILKNSVSIPTFQINNEIKANTSLGFVRNYTQCNVNIYSLIKTSYSVNLCDRQILNDLLNVKGCGCYGVSANLTRLVIQYSMSVQTVQCGRSQIDQYFSLKFNKLYSNTYIPGLCKF